MSMTVCDLSAITKPWDIEKRVADQISSEFFEQGDVEREELKITPIDIMNREKEDQLPMMQVGFIDDICLPVYEVRTCMQVVVNSILYLPLPFPGFRCSVKRSETASWWSEGEQEALAGGRSCSSRNHQESQEQPALDIKWRNEQQQL